MCVAALGTVVGAALACGLAVAAFAVFPYVSALLEPRR